MAIVRGFTDNIGQIVEVGSDLIRGLWQGITNVADWIWGKISGFFSGIVGSIKSFFGIGSPSKLFAELGGFMAEGLGVGFEKEMADVARDMQDAIPSAFHMPDLTAGVTYAARPSRGFSYDTEGGGYGSIENRFIIEHMEVRSDMDIKRIAQELYALQRQALRKRGAVMV